LSRPRISAEDLEQAEQALARTYTIVAGQAAHERILMRASVDPDAFDNFMRHHKERLFRQYIPDADPRMEPAIVTMLLHFFAVGAVAQRFSDGRPS
jgi:hypothetical protein